MLFPPLSDTCAANELARRHLRYFVQLTTPGYLFTGFHENYIKIIDAFAKRKIRRLIISIPPQHGKSQISTRVLPAYLFGLNPDYKIAIGSYSSTLAMSFNRDVQRYIDTDEYSGIFPNTKINSKRVVTVDGWLRNASQFEIVNRKGSLMAVGRGGGLTGHMVDVMIMDDLFKDFEEGNSPIVRESAWQWYVNVVKTRLHNDSQELIVFTRWNEDDIIGRLEKIEKVITLESLDQLENVDPFTWVKVNFEAIKESPQTEIDKRSFGESLFPERHSIEKLIDTKKLDAVRFQCLYQGNPLNKEGLLYDTFKTYSKLPETTANNNYTDTADLGNDYLCSICYSVGIDNNIYITDIVYTQEPMEVTERLVSAMIERNDTRLSYIESNTGGRSFARNIERMTRKCKITWFNQNKNKESRIKTNSSTVNKFIYFPDDWAVKHSLFHSHLVNFKSMFAANKHDDIPDVLTGIIEKETTKNKAAIIW
jgi:predicted phage terminase large subunit-like protein